MTRRRITLIALSVVVAGGLAALLLLWIHRAARPIRLQGAVMVRSDDVDKQVPIPGVQVTVPGGLAAASAWSDERGFFGLTLGKHVRPGQPIVLQFRRPEYAPLDLTVAAGKQLDIARMLPIPKPTVSPANLSRASVSSITIRYSASTATLLNVGSVVKTFRVVNIGNVPCHARYPCSPDGKWKATVGSASLEAPSGDVFSSARVSCIAGPCPFTKIRSDEFSGGGPTVSVKVINWSDTTTFLFEAEIFHPLISGAVRISYPVIFGRTLHFTVPDDAEGVCIEADMDGEPLVFPLGPEPLLTWATCSVSVSAEHAMAYQCELKPGYKFGR